MVRRAKVRGAGSVVAYIRVSKDDQNLGLEAQRQTIGEWAAREGVQVTAWHADDGVSGGNSLADRPALVEAIRALRRGDVLVISKRDRLARESFVAAQVSRMVENVGAKIISADGIANGETPSDVLMRHMLDGMAAFERQLIAARTKAALAVKRSRGERIGQIPYGFRLKPNGIHRQVKTPDGATRRACAEDCTGCVHLEAHEDEQSNLARMRELEPSRSCQAISDALADEGIFNRNGKPFARQAVHEILKENR
jgi:site-specific DNA recombinase